MTTVAHPFQNNVATMMTTTKTTTAFAVTFLLRSGDGRAFWWLFLMWRKLRHHAPQAVSFISHGRKYCAPGQFSSSRKQWNSLPGSSLCRILQLMGAITSRLLDLMAMMKCEQVTVAVLRNQSHLCCAACGWWELWSRVVNWAILPCKVME